jgi:hypothetical protein
MLLRWHGKPLEQTGSPQELTNLAELLVVLGAATR